jgi:hypothetical protein
MDEYEAGRHCPELLQQAGIRVENEEALHAVVSARLDNLAEVPAARQCKTLN